MIHSYITGSRAYGYPTESSDLDLVVVLHEQDYKDVWKFKSSTSLMFGNLNLVLFNADNEEDMRRYAAWKAAHDFCVANRPMCKEDCIQVFRIAGAESKYMETKDATIL